MQFQPDPLGANIAFRSIALNASLSKVQAEFEDSRLEVMLAVDNWVED